jgi:Alpha galactosidase C-terminal beta sandwich domain
VIKSTGSVGNKTQVWAGPLSKNEYVVMLFNKSVKEDVLINFTFKEIGYS